MDNTKETINTFNTIAIQQDKKGMDKYGKPVNPLDKYNWNDMAIEELVDAMKYIVASKIKTETIIEEVINELKQTRELILYSQNYGDNKHEAAINIGFCINKLYELKEGTTKQEEL